MKIAIVYIYAPIAGPQYEWYADRFLRSYHDNQPGLDHDSIIVLNGPKASGEVACFFSSLPNLQLLEHDNSGFDIGGFQAAARNCNVDLIVFFGASTYFQRPGWLLRMATSFQKHGHGLYGAMGNKGNLAVHVWPHIRTTAFWMRPDLMTGYPSRVTRADQRHPFEHGPNCLTEWVRKQGLNAWVITWAGDYLWAQWDESRNGFQRGNQMDLLACDHLCEPPYYMPGFRR